MGHLLARHFQHAGHNVTVLTRGPYAANWLTVHWDGLTPGPWIEHLNGADVCINLAGRSVNCRYTERRRREIYDSRIRSTELLGRVIASVERPPALWINSSTATIYRHAVDREMDEATGELGGNEALNSRRRVPETWNFSVGVARDWEQAFFSAPAPHTRKVALRTAILFAPQPGGAFEVLSRLVRAGLGGKQGSGDQFVSWIHADDFLRAVDFLIARHEIDGPVNIASPYPIANRDFMGALREAWQVPNGIPAPAPLIEFAAFLLRTESELVLKSRCVVPGRLLDAGFTFHWPNWPEAAANLVSEWRRLAR